MQTQVKMWLGSLRLDVSLGSLAQAPKTAPGPAVPAKALLASRGGVQGRGVPEAPGITWELRANTIRPEHWGFKQPEVGPIDTLAAPK